MARSSSFALNPNALHCEPSGKLEELFNFCIGGIATLCSKQRNRSGFNITVPIALLSGTHILTLTYFP